MDENNFGATAGWGLSDETGDELFGNGGVDEENEELWGDLGDEDDDVDSDFFVNEASGSNDDNIDNNGFGGSDLDGEDDLDGFGDDFGADDFNGNDGFDSFENNSSDSLDGFDNDFGGNDGFGSFDDNDFDTGDIDDEFTYDIDEASQPKQGGNFTRQQRPQQIPQQRPQQIPQQRPQQIPQQRPQQRRQPIAQNDSNQLDFEDNGQNALENIGENVIQRAGITYKKAAFIFAGAFILVALVIYFISNIHLKSGDGNNTSNVAVENNVQQGNNQQTTDNTQQSVNNQQQSSSNQQQSSSGVQLNGVSQDTQVNYNGEQQTAQGSIVGKSRYFQDGQLIHCLEISCSLSNGNKTVHYYCGANVFNSVNINDTVQVAYIIISDGFISVNTITK